MFGKHPVSIFLEKRSFPSKTGALNWREQVTAPDSRSYAGKGFGNLVRLSSPQNPFLKGVIPRLTGNDGECAGYDILTVIPAKAGLQDRRGVEPDPNLSAFLRP